MKQTVWIRYALVLMLCGACLVPVIAAAPPEVVPLDSPVLRVGLSRFGGAAVLTVRAEPGARLMGPDGRVKASGSGGWTFAVRGGGVEANDARGRSLGKARPGETWRVETEDEEARVSVAAPGGAARRYRGSLELSSASGRLSVVNDVALEAYLRGVVGSEMGASSPAEALKAQAIAARTFALYRRERSLAAASPFDVTDTTDAQVYGGADAEWESSNRAVSDTEGVTLIKGGKLIAAMFGADCGGATTPGAAPDECPNYADDADAHGSPEAPSPPAWTLTYPADKLAAALLRLPAARPEGSSAPVLAGVEAVEVDVSGRVRRLRLTWARRSETKQEEVKKVETEETAVLSGEDDVSAPSVPPSVGVTREITGNALRTLLGLNTLRSTLFTVKRAPGGDFVIEGRGWGHGRGLCQVGAKALAAQQGFDFRAILDRYYRGASLARVVYTEEGDDRQISGAKGGNVSPGGRHGR